MKIYVKKIAVDVDNSPNYSEKRYQMICQIQNFLKEGCSYREISKRMGVGRNTIAKYREGDPKELSMFGIRQSKLDPYYDFIIQCLASGWSKSKTVKAIYEKGLEVGIEKGIMEGSQKEKIEIAKKMLKLKIDKETIAEATGLTEQEIEKILD